jgi:hypothetical protein
MPAQDGRLLLNIPGATANIAELNSLMRQIDAEAANLKKKYQDLFCGAIAGQGAVEGNDFGMQLDNRVFESKALISACINATQDAIDRTIGFDQSGFGGTAGFR